MIEDNCGRQLKIASQQWVNGKGSSDDMKQQQSDNSCYGWWIRRVVQGNLAASNARQYGGRQHDKKRGVEKKDAEPLDGGHHNKRGELTM
jgi:hypothetical protein